MEKGYQVAAMYEAKGTVSWFLDWLEGGYRMAGVGILCRNQVASENASTVTNAY